MENWFVDNTMGTLGKISGRVGAAHTAAQGHTLNKLSYRRVHLHAAPPPPPPHAHLFNE